MPFSMERKREQEERTRIPPTEREIPSPVPTTSTHVPPSRSRLQGTTMEGTTELGKGSYTTTKPKEERTCGCRAGARVQQKKEAGKRLTGIYNLSGADLTKEETNILQM